MRRGLFCWAMGVLAACGSEGTSDETGAREPAPPPSQVGGANPSPPASTVDRDLLGVWEVRGTDERGDYTGQIEFASDANAMRFTRVIRYTTLKVETDRDLFWVWAGQAKGTKENATATVELKARDFLAKRGTLTRTGTEPPVRVTGAIKPGQAGELVATYTGLGGEILDTLSARKPSSAPIFAGIERTQVDSHDPPSALAKSTLFSTFASYHEMDQVKPYVNRPEFQAAVHGHYIDKTDFGFYQANPNALRIINKTIDPISLLETKMRADAFRHSLAQKAALFDRQMVQYYFGDWLYQVPDAKINGQNIPSPDATLWTGVYAASQAFRFLVTGEAEAKTNLEKSVDVLLKHQEITGDRSQFARVLRPAQGNPQLPWRAGTGAFADIEWRQGGNNDMVKGLVYGYTMAHRVFCNGSGYESLCRRIRTNAKYLADDVHVDNTETGVSSNDVNHSWLAAVVLDGLDAVTYRAKAEGYFAAASAFEVPTSTFGYEQGIGDFSGSHLGIVSHISRWFMADKVELRDAKKKLREGIKGQDKAWGRQRMTMWNVMRAGLISDPKTQEAADDARWRLREIPFPKVARPVNHRISDDFCISPYPYQPWKNDWTTSDRFTSLRSYPIFEDSSDVYHWKTGFDIGSGKNDGESVEYPAPDFLHAYWLARYFNVLSAAE